MSLSTQDIDRIANLAKLELAPAEAERMLHQINGLFELVEKMRAVDTAGVEPLAHPISAIADVSLHLADDVVREPGERETNQRSAPMVEQGLYLVPRVVE
ncbi:MAG: Asp-tRNA(Asn)/Glu-tRNA(Gln) amidotransferase subunit GatC [Burkholderiales bacterium]